MPDINQEKILRLLDELISGCGDDTSPNARKLQTVRAAFQHLSDELGLSRSEAKLSNRLFAEQIIRADRAEKALEKFNEAEDIGEIPRWRLYVGERTRLEEDEGGDAPWVRYDDHIAKVREILFRQMNYRPVGWIREWDGDESDIGMYHFVAYEDETKDGYEWTRVYVPTESMYPICDTCKRPKGGPFRPVEMCSCATLKYTDTVQDEFTVSEVANALAWLSWYGHPNSYDYMKRVNDFILRKLQESSSFRLSQSFVTRATQQDAPDIAANGADEYPYFQRSVDREMEKVYEAIDSTEWSVIDTPYTVNYAISNGYKVQVREPKANGWTSIDEIHTQTISELLQAGWKFRRSNEKVK